MRLTIEKINARQFRLNLHDPKNLANYNNIRLVNESNTIFFESNARTKIRNWEGLSKDTNEAYSYALDTLDMMLEYGVSDSSINNECQFLLHEAIKVRNAAQLRRSFKYRLSRLKSKIYGNIHKKHEDVEELSDKTKDNINRSKPLDAHGQRPKQETRITLADKCYNLLEQEFSSIHESDRITKQYASIHSRFNIDKILSECADGSRDIYGTIYTIASYVDTYRAPFKNIYNTALETAWYGLNKKHIYCENQDIINAVTDYYIFNGGLSESEITDIKSIKNITPIFEEYDFDILSYLDDEVPDETISQADFDYYGYDGKPLNIEEELQESTLDKIVGIAKADNSEIQRNEEIRKLIQDFKKECSANVNSAANIITLKAIVSKITTDCPEQIAYEFSSILQILRMGFVLYNDTMEVSKVSSMVTDLVKSAMDTTIKQPQLQIMINALKNEVELVKKHIQRLGDTDQDSVTKLTAYIDTLTENMEELKTFNDNTFSTMDDISNAEGGENDEEATNGDNLSEAATVILISNLIESITAGMLYPGDMNKIISLTEQDEPVEVTVDKGVNEIICGNIAKFSTDTIDTLIDFSNTAPDVIDKEKLRESLVQYRETLRSGTPSVSDYIKINAINDSLDKLSEVRIYNTYSDYTDAKGVIAYLMCLDEIKHMNSDTDSIYFTEGMSFTNTLKLALNNIRRKAVNLSEKEKQASATIDGAVNSIMKSMDRQMSDSEREAVARGSILPSASKCLKIALAIGAIGIFVSPVLAVISAIGVFFCRKRATQRERQLALDEIEIELKMCERYLRMYEEKNDLKAVRQCEIIQRNLQRQHQRIKYRMKIDFRSADTTKLPLGVTDKN